MQNYGFLYVDLCIEHFILSVCDVQKNLDYSDFFDPDIGQQAGLICWEIENFLPNRLDDALHGKFYEGDAYIILNVILDSENEASGVNRTPQYQIFFWIGSKSTLDKKACAAIHAVNLRNFLRADCRTLRQDQFEEEDEFLALFPGGISYIEGGRTSSGFYSVEEAEFTTRYAANSQKPFLL